jgi:hypothetical protein
MKYLFPCLIDCHRAAGKQKSSAYPGVNSNTDAERLWAILARLFISVVMHSSKNNILRPWRRFSPKKINCMIWWWKRLTLTQRAIIAKCSVPHITRNAKLAYPLHIKRARISRPRFLLCNKAPPQRRSLTRYDLTRLHTAQYWPSVRPWNITGVCKKK